jgi:PadR family transcriptional regulator, regulatory protein PadR
MADSSELLPGTLDLLVLQALTFGAEHGWGVGHRINLMSGGMLEVNQGSLYPALQRMRGKGWIRTEWRRTENNRRARYYMLTRAGEKQLERERASWERSSFAVDHVLKWAGGGA